jgi:DNA-binding GntR family transcriptional regulator
MRLLPTCLSYKMMISQAYLSTRWNSPSLRIAHPPNLRAKVVENIRAAIVAGVFPPGMRLVEKELCERLGVSRSSIREALRPLEVEGLIENPPAKGPTVAVIDAATAKSIYEVRSALESLAARLFVRHATQMQADALSVAVERLAAAYASGSLLETLPAKNAFYEVLFDGAGNPVIANTLRTLNSRVSQLRGTSLSSPNRLTQSLDEIHVLRNALVARDEEAAAQACREHVERAAEAALHTLATSDTYAVKPYKENPDNSAFRNNRRVRPVARGEETSSQRGINDQEAGSFRLALRRHHDHGNGARLSGSNGKDHRCVLCRRVG